MQRTYLTLIIEQRIPKGGVRSSECINNWLIGDSPTSLTAVVKLDRQIKDWLKFVFLISFAPPGVKVCWRPSQGQKPTRYGPTLKHSSTENSPHSVKELLRKAQEGLKFADWNHSMCIIQSKMPLMRSTRMAFYSVTYSVCSKWGWASYKMGQTTHIM